MAKRRKNAFFCFLVVVMLWTFPEIIASFFGTESAALKFIENHIPERRERQHRRTSYHQRSKGRRVSSTLAMSLTKSMTMIVIPHKMSIERMRGVPLGCFSSSMLVLSVNGWQIWRTLKVSCVFVRVRRNINILPEKGNCERGVMEILRQIL